MSVVVRMFLRCILVSLGFAGITYLCPLVGQSTYSGDYQLDRLQGSANFTFLVERGDTVFDGPFRMEAGELTLSENGDDSYFLIDGGYVKDIPTGDWVLRFGQLEPTGAVGLRDYKYQVQLDGTLHEAGGRLKEGQLQGKWIHEVVEIKQSARERRLFRSESEFEDGIPQLAIQIENEENVLLGRFLRSGLAHDVWTLYRNSEESEHWHFQDGRLVSISVPQRATDRQINVFPSYAGPTQTINLDDRFLNLLEVMLQIAGEKYSISGSSAAQLIKENSRLYAKVQTLLLSKERYDTPLPFQVIVPFQALTPQELDDLSQIEENLFLIDSLSQAIISNSSINIAKVTDAEVGYWQAVAATLSADYIRPVRQLAHYADRGILAFIPRDTLWRFLWPDTRASTALDIKYEILGSEIIRPYKLPAVDSSRIPLGETGPIVQITQSVLNQIDTVNQRIRTKVQTTAGSDQFAAIEEQLIDTVRMLNRILDSAHVDNMAESALQKIQSEATEVLTRYSSVEDIDAKQVQANNALNCLSHFNALARQVAFTPIQWELIQVEYTDKVWNNFTSTVMSEEVKRRITRSYRDVLMPYLFQLVTDKLSCANAASLAQAFAQSYDKMLWLRNEDTTKLERKLKNENDAEAVMDLLGITTADPVRP